MIIKRYLLKASINKGEKGIMRFNDNGVLDTVEFKIWNLNHKYEWKQVNFENKASFFAVFKG